MFDIVIEKVGRLADIEGDFPIDEDLLARKYHHMVSRLRASSQVLTCPGQVFPSNAIVLSAEHYGQSAWTQTGCVTVELGDGTLKKYFLKVSVETS